MRFGYLNKIKKKKKLYAKGNVFSGFDFFFLFGGCAMCNVHCALDIDNLGNRGIYIELH